MFTRPLIALSLDDDPSPAIALTRAIAGDARSVRVLLCVSQIGGFSLGEPDLVGFERALAQGDAKLNGIRDRLAVDGIEATGEVVVARPEHALRKAIAEAPPDLVVFGAFGSTAREMVASWAQDVAHTLRIAAAVGVLAPGRAPAVRCYLHPFDGHAASLAAIAPFLRDYCDARHSAVLVAFGALDPRVVAEQSALAEIAGLRAHVSIEAFEGGFIAGARDLDALANARGADALLITTEAWSGLVADLAARVALRTLIAGSLPTLFVPALGTVRAAREGTLDPLDAIASRDDVVIRIERVGTLDGPSPIDDGEIQVVSSGRLITATQSHRGLITFPRSLLTDDSVGIGRAVEKLDPLAAVEAAAGVERTGTARVALVDARFEGEALARVHTALDNGSRVVFAVRLSPEVPAREIRTRWIAAGFTRPRVLDVRDLLDEGDTSDVPAEVAGVRLSRAAARLRANGVCVDAVVVTDAGRARAEGFTVIAPATIDGAAQRIEQAYAAPPSTRDLAARLDTTTASRIVPGHTVRVDLDNGDARRALIALVDSAVQRVHAQWYIVEDDEITREIEAALVRAATRGITVRILVDSLLSGHGSFGRDNPLLTRLASAHGIELRVVRPIDHVPSLEDLKARDHRKLVIVDGQRGVVSGRNLGKAYFRAFDEARITPESPYTEVPWFDSSATIAGPAVATLDASFLEAWTGAGGSPFEIAAAAPAGDTPVRIVIHRGLADAYTLEAYLALIETAHTNLVVVNNFPLQFEVQHALLAAIARGVKLAMLVGCVRPLYGDDIAFAGGTLRAIADTLIRARLAALVQAGADVRELVLPPIANWDPRLGKVRPHVHAKLVCADHRLIAVGSANLDVTAGYWESEALVVIDDPGLVADVEARLTAVFAASSAIDPTDAKWRNGAPAREWLERVWPSILA